MIARQRFALAVLAAIGCGFVSSPAPAQARLEAVAFSALQGWAQDDPSAAFDAFRAGCRLNVDGGPMRIGKPRRVDLAPACRAALALPARSGQGEARAFFERHFTPHRILPESGEGFLTGYFEPVIAGSTTRTARFSMPLLARPPELVDLSKGQGRGALEGLTAARRLPDGKLAPMPDRAAIEGGALAGRGLELVWLDPVDAFFVHVQGSTRVKLTDGRLARFAFAGRSGHPFTAIGRLLVERGAFTREEASMDTIRAWLAANPGEAPALMRENRAFIFFRRDPRSAEHEAVGGAGVPLTPGRSLAVDRRIWPYNLPVWISAALPLSGEGTQDPFHRLMVMQDTGSAIVGPARGDIFFGSGEALGRVAGRIRHPGSFAVLLPRAAQ